MGRGHDFSWTFSNWVLNRNEGLETKLNVTLTTFFKFLFIKLSYGQKNYVWNRIYTSISNKKSQVFFT